MNERWPHADGIHLLLSSLGSVVVDSSGVRSVRGEDASGGFGIWPGHADFLTVLGVGVFSWRDRQDRWHHCALRRGVLTMRHGVELQIATREAIPGDDIDHLEQVVLAQFAQRQDAEDQARRTAHQLQVRALHELVRPLTGVAAKVWP
jgi:F-type H+-transporting ATPase subunit epsilon